MSGPCWWNRCAHRVGVGVCALVVLDGCEALVREGAPIEISEAKAPDGGIVSLDAADAAIAVSDAGAGPDAARAPDAGPTETGVGHDAAVLVGVDSGPVLVGALDVPWVDWPEQTSTSDGRWGSVLTDVMQHSPPDEVFYDSDLITQAHETLHGIDIHLNLERTGWTGWFSFYALDDRSISLPEPAIRKAQVAPYIPEPFRRSRYDLYVVNQTDWDDHPLYLWEEWNAYLIGTTVGVDLVASGLWSGGWRDACMGTLEFISYGLGVGLAIEDLDAGYFTAQPAAHAFLGFMLQRSFDTFRACAPLPSFAWGEQDAYYQLLRTGEPGEPLRAFMRRTYGDALADAILDLAP